MNVTRYVLKGWLLLLLSAGVWGDSWTSQSPETVINHIRSYHEDAEQLEKDIAEVLPLLEDGRVTLGELKYPQSPASECKRLLRLKMDVIEDELVALYPDQTERVQLALMEMFGWGMSPASFDVLWSGLKNEQESIRRMAMDGVLKREEDAHVYIQSLPDQNRVLNYVEEVRVLGVMAEESSVKDLLPVLNSSERALVEMAQWALSEIAKKNPASVLAAYDEEKPDAVLAGMLNALSDIENEDTAALMARVLDETSPTLLRKTILETCQYVHEPAVLKEVLDALFEEDGDLRVSAIQALGRSQDPDMAYPMTCISLISPYALREKIQPELQMLGPEGADRLLELLRSPDTGQYILALRGLQMFGDVAAPGMLKAIQWPGLDVGVRGTLAFLLSAVEDLEGHPDDIGFFRLAASYPVVESGGRKRWLPMYLQVASHPDPVMRMGAISHLSGFYDEKSVDVMVEALRDPELSVVQVAGRALRPRLYTIRERLVNMLLDETIAASRRIAAGLIEAGYDPHRPVDLAELYGSLERWDALSSIPASGIAHILHQWRETTSNRSVLRYAYFLSNIDRANIDAVYEREKIGEMFLPWMPWQDESVRLEAFRTVDSLPKLDQFRVLALAAFSPPLHQEFLRYMKNVDDLPLPFLLAMMESGISTLDQLARDVLYEREEIDMLAVERAMMSSPSEVARVLADVLKNHGYAPDSFDRALTFHRLLGGWYQLAAMGDLGLEAIEDAKDSVFGRKRLELIVLISNMKKVHPIWPLLDETVKDVKGMFPHLLEYFQNHDEAMLESLHSAILHANWSQTQIIVQLMRELDAAPTEGPEFLCYQSFRVPLSELAENPDFLAFCNEELVGASGGRVLRASLWRLRMAMTPKARMGETVKTFEDFETMLLNTNRLHVISAIRMAPRAASMFPERVDEIVKLLAEKLGSEQELYKEFDGTRLGYRMATAGDAAVDSLVTIGAPAVGVLQQVWNYEGIQKRLLAAKAISRISDERLTGIQKWLIEANHFPLTIRVNSIYSLAGQKNLKHLPYLFDWVFVGDTVIQGAAYDGLALYGDNAREFLIEILKESHPTRQRIAIRLLKDIGGDEVVDVFEQELGRHRASIMPALIRALGELRSPTSLPILTKMLRESSGSRFLLLSNELVAWGPEAFPYVLDQLLVGNEKSTTLMLSTLRRLTGQDFGTNVDAWKAWAEKTNFVPDTE